MIPEVRRDVPAARSGGFTLLELVISVTLLATFILPMLHLISEARVRAVRYTTERQVRELAQQKLHDRIHYYEVEDAGTFEADGRPLWRWEMDPPEMRSQGEQVILAYTIRVSIPQKLEGSAGGGGAGAGTQAAGAGQLDWYGPGGEGSTYQYTLWTLPDERWYEEQQYLYEQGYYSPLDGYPDGSAGAAVPAGR